MEKSWVNFVKCLLHRLYKLCLTYLYFSGIYFNVEFFFGTLGGRTSLISSNQNLFLSNVIFLLITCYSYTIYKNNMFFQNNKLPFVAAIIYITESIVFIWKWITFYIFCQTMLMGWNHLRNILKCLNTLGTKFQIMD